MHTRVTTWIVARSMYWAFLLYTYVMNTQALQYLTSCHLLLHAVSTLDVINAYNHDLECVRDMCSGVSVLLNSDYMSQVHLPSLPYLYAHSWGIALMSKMLWQPSPRAHLIELHMHQLYRSHAWKFQWCNWLLPWPHVRHRVSEKCCCLHSYTPSSYVCM